MLLIKKGISLSLEDQNEIRGSLAIPANSCSIVIFAHGSGSTKNSYRNQLLAQVLNNNGFGTLLFDLLTEDEIQMDSNSEEIASMIPGTILNKYNIKLLTERLRVITQWVQSCTELQYFHIGYFGASADVDAALQAAATSDNIRSVVSRGGRTDLVDIKMLSEVKCPCLFIVGGRDKKIIEINKGTLRQLKKVKSKKMQIIPDASHLFEEYGKIEQVADLSVDWFKRYM